MLEERLRLMRIEKYGAGGEQLSQAQMQLFELEPVVSEMIEQPESEHAPLHRSTRESHKHPGRQELPASLPRVERILRCTPDQHLCKRCGRETVVIGYEESSQLDVEPAKYFVLVTKREKRACRSCEDLGVISAPLPARIIEKCLASDRIVIETVVGKYCNHTPLHRQSMILERDAPDGTCLPPPFDGALLQIMPWPIYHNMTNHDLRAIYEYLSAVPCIAGPPAPSPLHNDCE